ncbi:hypothetical protein PENSPDRAFT_337176 [Peniophora sp. CONT]|nr:hypothetical protein PENSPDRAFT_337176 [Peniophora sp. CONT]
MQKTVRVVICTLWARTDSWLLFCSIPCPVIANIDHTRFRLHLPPLNICLSSTPIVLGFVIISFATTFSGHLMPQCSPWTMLRHLNTIKFTAVGMLLLLIAICNLYYPPSVVACPCRPWLK